MTDPATSVPLFVPADRYLVPSLPTVWFGIVLFALAAYVALDGFDFGIGVLYATRTDEAERETLLAAFGPVWDANEVWVVAFGTSLLAAFPPAYAALLSEHYLPAIAFVVALLFRGVAPELREQRDDEAWRRACDRSFVGGSVAAPLLLGALLGSWVFGAGVLSVPALLTAAVVFALSLASGAAYVAAKTEGALRADARRYGTAATVVALVAAAALLAAIVGFDAGGLRSQLLAPSGLGITALAVALGVAGLAFAQTGRDRLWFGSAVGVAASLVALFGALLYPVLYPAQGLTVGAAAVSPLALNLVTVFGLPVLALVLGYFGLLYGVFSGPVDAEGYGA